MLAIDRSPRQFSIRDLLGLTLIVSVVLTIVELSRGSGIFGALASSWTWVSFALIGAAWLTARRRRNSKNRLVAASMLMYAVSMMLPALSLRWGDGIEFGGSAWLGSYVFGLGHVVELLDPPEPSFFVVDARLPFACLLGMIANSLVILGWITFYRARYCGRRSRVTCCFAWASFVFMAGCVIPIALAAELGALYPGFAAWATSALLLAHGAVCANREVSNSLAV